MATTLASHTFQVEDQTTHYLESGPPDGPLLIFIHGWPDIGLTWQHQLKAFASLGFRVVAPDTRGYGESTAPTDKRAYRLEQLVKEHLALLKQLQREKAIWIAHDWGCGILSALAAHHPEVIQGGVWLSVPYRTIELGLDHLVSLVNRDLYPKNEYEFGQWEYMKYYEERPDAANEELNPQTDRVHRMFYIKSNPATFGKPSSTATILRNGGFLGRFPSGGPDIPLEATCLDDKLYDLLVEDKKKHSWFPATAYYLNHTENAEYDKSAVNEAALTVPCLYLDARFDAVCSSTTSPEHNKAMRKACKNLTEAWIEAGHWLHMEKPSEVNAVLAKWLSDSFPEQWPYVQKLKMQKL